MGNYQGGVMTEGRGGFLGLLDVFAHVGCEPWCSRGRVWTRLRKFSDGQPLLQGRLEALEWTAVFINFLKVIHMKIPLRAIPHRIWLVQIIQ